MLFPGVIEDAVGCAHNDATAKVAVGDKGNKKLVGGVVAEPVNEGGALGAVGEGGKHYVNLGQIKGFEMVEEGLEGFEGGRFACEPSFNDEHGFVGVVGFTFRLSPDTLADLVLAVPIEIVLDVIDDRFEELRAVDS